MKYLVTRISKSDDEIKPCEEAFETSYYEWDTRRYKSEEEFDSRLKIMNCLPWKSEGEDHQVCKEGIKRKFLKSGWAIEINNLEELDSFIKKYGDIVISNYRYSIPKIEIYDDYRE